MLYLYQDTISFQASGEVEQLWARQNKKLLTLFIGLNVYWGVGHLLAMSRKLSLMSSGSGKVLKEKWDFSSSSCSVYKHTVWIVVLAVLSIKKNKNRAEWSKFSKKYLQNSVIPESKKLSWISWYHQLFFSSGLQSEYMAIHWDVGRKY